MLTVTILILYLSTPSSSSGKAVTTAEFASLEACEAAGRKSLDQLGGVATTVRWSCSPKSAAVDMQPGPPQGR